MTFEELRGKLAQLEAKKAAEQELAGLRSRQKTVERLERDKEALLESLASMPPEVWDSLVPEERRRIHKMMRLKAAALLDGGIEVNCVIAPINEVGPLEIAS